MNLREKINAGAVNKAPRICLYGVPGIGKTTLASKAPKAILIPTEDGANYVKCDKFPLVKTFDELIDDINLLLTEQHDYKTVVIDSVDWAERLIEAHVLKNNNAKSLAKAGQFGSGYQEFKLCFDRMLCLLSRFAERGIMVIFTAHCDVKKIPDPETQDATELIQYSLKLYGGSEKNPGGTLALLTEWVDCLLFYTRKNSVKKAGDKYNVRVLHTQNTNFSSGKNRWNLPESLEEPDWEKLLSYYKNTINQKEATNATN